MKVLALATLAFAGHAAAYAPAARTALRGAKASAVSARAAPRAASVFEGAMANFEKDFPEFSKRGFGPTTKAERWNGRHAMFGWVVILATGYAQSHNLIPNFDAPLDLSAWGPLARQGDYSSITNGRAIILIAHVHALFVSLASSLSPFGFQDSLTLNMKAAERDEAAYGLFVPIPGQAGLTAAAEMMNGRLAMLGLIAAVGASLATGQPLLEVVNTGLGGLLLK
ncbi:hypothetical protein KFE25_013862 [Diacronema lutheri]|uniref:Uncharacterized protein n=2 Tax=Diacronema lutheri TaxID=2081491 RepID=A0A8J6CBU4_DIALT|nr:hypothetical protein KFE25_013862 [Diacronema lutheri]